MQDKIVVSSFWATVLVIGTLLSPIVTIILNRIFDLVAKRLNNQHERYESYNSRKRELLEQYLVGLVEAERAETPEERKNLKLIEVSYLLIPYLPNYMQETFQRYALEAANRKHDAKSNADFQTVTIFIKELLDPRGRRWIYSTKHKKWIWKRPNKALSCFRQWRSKWK